MGRRIGVGGCLAIVSFSATAAAEPQRGGFTGDLGLGFALTSVRAYSVSVPTETTNSTNWSNEKGGGPKAGLAPLSFSLGVFFSPTVALLFRISGTSFFDDGDQFSHTFYGPIVEIWPHDRFYLSGGVGLALYGTNPFLSGSNEKPENGWALDFRVGVALINGQDHDLTLSVEAIPGFYDQGAVQGYAILAAWKWY